MEYDTSKIGVFDNFLENPDNVRQSALNSGFGAWKPNKGLVGSSNYEGMNFWGDHATCLQALSKKLGCYLFPNSMFFRITNETTESAYVHSDRMMGDVTAIVYLSKHDKDESGTGFYRHRERKILEMPTFDVLQDDKQLQDEMVKGSDEVWEQMHFVNGKYNRCVIFPAPLFHSRVPKHGIGKDTEGGRMVWVTHLRGLK